MSACPHCQRSVPVGYAETRCPQCHGALPRKPASRPALSPLGGAAADAALARARGGSDKFPAARGGSDKFPVARSDATAEDRWDLPSAPASVRPPQPAVPPASFGRLGESDGRGTPSGGVPAGGTRPLGALNEDAAAMILRAKPATPPAAQSNGAGAAPAAQSNGGGTAPAAQSNGGGAPSVALPARSEPLARSELPTGAGLPAGAVSSARRMGTLALSADARSPDATVSMEALPPPPSASSGVSSLPAHARNSAPTLAASVPPPPPSTASSGDAPVRAPSSAARGTLMGAGLAVDVPAGPSRLVSVDEPHPTATTPGASGPVAPVPAPTAASRLELSVDATGASAALAPSIPPAAASEPPAPLPLRTPGASRPRTSSTSTSTSSSSPASGTLVSRPSSPGVNVTAPRKPVLASDVLREDLVPHEPGAQSLRLVLGVAGAFLVATAAISGLRSPQGPAAWAIPGVAALTVALAPVRYATRALLGFAPALPAFGVVALTAVARSTSGALVLTALCATLPAALLFRANFRASRRARGFLAVGLALGLLWLLHPGGGALASRGAAGAPWALGHFGALALMPVLLLATLGFMGQNTQAGCRAWATLTVLWAFVALAGPGPWHGASGVDLLLAAVSGVALSAVLAVSAAALLAVYARPAEPSTGIGVAAGAATQRRSAG